MVAVPQTTVEAKTAAVNRTFRALPPTIEQFIDDPYYLGLGDQCCDLVRETALAVFAKRQAVDVAVLIWGIGAGKSFAVKLFDLYIAYVYLCLRDPWAYYGMDPTGPATAIVNFSVTATQAKRVVFDSIAKAVDTAPCFKQPGFQRDKTISSELRWPDHGLVIFPGNSEAESAIGYNVLAAVVDEANFLPDVEQSVRVAGRTTGHHYDAANELHNAISDRIKSRGNWRWQRDSLEAYISSPRYVNDFTERMAVEAATNRRIYCSRAATWEGAKKRHLCGRTFTDAVIGQVPVEYEPNFTRDPERSRRDLGARPSEAIGGFFSDPDVLERNANHERQSPFGADGKFLEEWSGRGEPAICIHVDLGLKRDACGIGGATSRGDKVRVEFCKRITPADHGGEIDFAAVRQFILDIRDKHEWSIAQVSFDGWQSVDSRQQLQKAGIHTEELSVDRNTEAYDTLKELINEGRLDYYADPDFIGEARRLELVKGKKVDHPPGGSKDVTDGVAGAVHQAAQKVSRYAYLLEDDDEAAPDATDADSE